MLNLIYNASPMITISVIVLLFIMVMKFSVTITKAVIEVVTAICVTLCNIQL